MYRGKKIPYSFWNLICIRVDEYIDYAQEIYNKKVQYLQK